jgi:sialic acid synthase SpsE
MFKLNTFIIAEVGSNWVTFEQAKDSISLAKKAGADAVKFQLFTFEALYGVGKDVGRAGQMPLDWLPRLKEKADACSIEFMCTAFSPALYDVVDPFVKRHKVASAENNHPGILKKVRALGKPVFVSTGATNEADIRWTVSALRSIEFSSTNPVPLTLLYCVAAYPARSIDLRAIPYLAKTFEVPVGFSDHSTDIIQTPRAAAELGATVIEKHFTAWPELNTPDRPHSLTVDEFTKMVAAIRSPEPYRYLPSHEETAMYKLHNRRLIARVDMGVGEILKADENYGAYRALLSDTNGGHPMGLDAVNGKRTTRNIRAGEGIGPSDVQ